MLKHYFRLLFLCLYILYNPYFTCLLLPINQLLRKKCFTSINILILLQTFVFTTTEYYE